MLWIEYTVHIHLSDWAWPKLSAMYQPIAVNAFDSNTEEKQLTEHKDKNWWRNPNYIWLFSFLLLLPAVIDVAVSDASLVNVIHILCARIYSDSVFVTTLLLHICFNFATMFWLFFRLDECSCRHFIFILGLFNDTVARVVSQNPIWAGVVQVIWLRTIYWYLLITC